MRPAFLRAAAIIVAGCAPRMVMARRVHREAQILHPGKGNRPAAEDGAEESKGENGDAHGMKISSHTADEKTAVLFLSQRLAGHRPPPRKGLPPWP